MEFECVSSSSGSRLPQHASQFFPGSDLVSEVTLDSCTQADFDPWSTWREAASQGPWPKDFGFLLSETDRHSSICQGWSRSSCKTSLGISNASEKSVTRFGEECEMASLQGRRFVLDPKRIDSLTDDHNRDGPQFVEQLAPRRCHASLSLSPSPKRRRPSLHGLSPSKSPRRKYGFRVHKRLFRAAMPYDGLKM